MDEKYTLIKVVSTQFEELVWVVKSPYMRFTVAFRIVQFRQEALQ